MAAACELLDWGHQVTLVERRPFLGGRAFSFTDTLTGSQIDNGQHVFLGCCTEYIRFLDKLGSLGRTHLQPSLDIRVMGPTGKVGRLKSCRMPGLFHLLPSFLMYPHLRWRDKLLTLYGLLRVKLADRSRAALERQSFYHWLKGHAQTQQAIDHFWDMISLPSLNDKAEDVSASMGLMVFQETMLSGRHSPNVGYARVGLSQLMGEAADTYIQKRGGALLLGKSVARILHADGEVTGLELADGSRLTGDIYLSALPYDVLARVLPPEIMAAEPLKQITGLSASPIVNAHIWYDRPVMDGDFVAVLDSPLQWVFNKSLILGADAASLGAAPVKGQYISVSVSGAWDYIHQPKEVLERTFLSAMADSFPRAAEAEVEKVLIVKQQQATFRCLPGTAACRPPAETPLRNLFLAGEWTDTGWPSTMEGAVRSGLRAAHAAVSSR